MKGMQEDNEPLFDSAENISLCIRVASGLIDDLGPYKGNMLAFLDGGLAATTDLADWLVVALDIPFREAHHITGDIVALGVKTRARFVANPA